MKHFFKLALLAASVGLAATPSMAKPVIWDMANEYNDTSIHAEGDKIFGEQLGKLTKGEIKVVHHFGGSIGYKSKDQLDAVADGALPLANTYVGPLGGIDPMFLLPSLPFLAKTPADARKLLDIARPSYDAVFKANNQKLLWASPWPASGFWAKKAIDSGDALANLKIRTYDANSTITLKEAKAAPIQLSWADVVPQLSTGGIDAVLTSAEGGTNAKFWEHLSHFTEVNYALPLNMVHINLDTWASLDKAKQDAVLKAAKMAEEHVWAALETRVAENYKAMKAAGVNVVTGVDPAFLASLAKAGEVARTEWLSKTGDKGRAILDAYMK
ncbi:MAG: TRAP transporter substrate-binding protein [Burkholderiaceae bacterium]